MDSFSTKGHSKRFNINKVKLKRGFSSGVRTINEDDEKVT